MSSSTSSSLSRVLEEERDHKERELIRKWAWNVFDSIEQHARYRGGGYASVADVDFPGIGGPTNPSAGRSNMFKGKMESFALAETMKYLYLILTDVSEVDRLLPRERTVFNTEAHPLHVTRD
jgi:mannosyl-oligosaccharide alpha-1,2-mannosidase